jgi:hypothetical protein
MGKNIPALGGASSGGAPRPGDGATLEKASRAKPGHPGAERGHSEGGFAVKKRFGWVLMVRTGFGDWRHNYTVYRTRLAALMARPGHRSSAYYARRVQL